MTEKELYYKYMVNKNMNKSQIQKKKQKHSTQ